MTEGELIARIGLPSDSLKTRAPEEIRATVDGIVNGVNVKDGQAVTFGEQILSVIIHGSKVEVLVLLPGSYAPQIHKGMPLVLKIDGYPQSHEDLTIGDIASGIIGPSDVERYVRTDIAKTLSLRGSVLIVRALLPFDSFETFDVAHEKLRYYDGMIGQAQISVREEPIIVALIPGVKQFY